MYPGRVQGIILFAIGRGPGAREGWDWRPIFINFVSEFNKFEFDTHTLPRSRFMYVIYRTIFLKIHDIMVESFKSFDIEHINKLGFKN